MAARLQTWTPKFLNLKPLPCVLKLINRKIRPHVQRKAGGGARRELASLLGAGGGTLGAGGLELGTAGVHTRRGGTTGHKQAAPQSTPQTINPKILGKRLRSGQHAPQEPSINPAPQTPRKRWNGTVSQREAAALGDMSGQTPHSTGGERRSLRGRGGDPPCASGGPTAGAATRSGRAPPQPTPKALRRKNQTLKPNHAVGAARERPQHDAAEGEAEHQPPAAGSHPGSGLSHGTATAFSAAETKAIAQAAAASSRAEVQHTLAPAGEGLARSQLTLRGRSVARAAPDAIATATATATATALTTASARLAAFGSIALMRYIHGCQNDSRAGEQHIFKYFHSRLVLHRGVLASEPAAENHHVSVMGRRRREQLQGSSEKEGRPAHGAPRSDTGLQRSLLNLAHSASEVRRYKDRGIARLKFIRNWCTAAAHFHTAKAR